MTRAPGEIPTPQVPQIFAVGSNTLHEGIRVWRFTESNPLTHTGDWLTVLGDPPQSQGLFDIGCATHIWGSAMNNIYVAGMVAGEAHMLYFDGTTWVCMTSRAGSVRRSRTGSGRWAFTRRPGIPAHSIPGSTS